MHTKKKQSLPSNIILNLLPIVRNLANKSKASLHSCDMACILKYRES